MYPKLPSNGSESNATCCALLLRTEAQLKASNRSPRRRRKFTGPIMLFTSLKSILTLNVVETVPSHESTYWWLRTEGHNSKLRMVMSVIIESRNCRGWKGPLEIIESNLSLHLCKVDTQFQPDKDLLLEDCMLKLVKDQIHSLFQA